MKEKIKIMDKKSKTISIFVMLLIVAFGIFFFIYKYYFEEEIIIEPTEKGLSEMITIDINKKTLIDKEENLIYSSTLQPKFDIFISENIDIKNLFFQLDDFGDILRKEFHGEITQQKEKNGLRLIFTPSFIIKPEKHFLVAKYQDPDKGLSSIKFDFILVFNEKFDEHLGESKVWVIPKGRSSEWFQVQDGKLLARPMTKDAHSSLAFIYPFNKDAKIDFELIPKGNNISLVFYFLEFGDFAIGSNDNERIVLFQKDKPNLYGKSFKMLIDHRYHVRITKKDFQYQLAIKKLNNNEQVDPTEQFFSDNILLQIDDSLPERLRVVDKHIGFSVWQNSEGVFLDDIFITNFLE